jgi:HSP20 family protein
MLMARWQPFSDTRSEFARLQSEMDRLFGRWDSNGPRPFARTVFPPLNLWEDDDHLYVEAELPGFNLDNLEIVVNGGNQLTLKGERKSCPVEGATWHRQERGCGEFHRVLELPCIVDSDQVSADFKNGVLTVQLPKHKSVKPRRITVKTS